MKIYYFTGTGNSLYTAKEISKKLNDNKIVSMLDGDDVADSSTVIITPLYHYSLPPIVSDFLLKLELKECDYLSLIVTAEFANGNAIEECQKIVDKKGIILNSAYYIKMPTNYLLSSKMLDDKKISKNLISSKKKILKICNDIKQRNNHIFKESKLYSNLLNTKKSYKKFTRKYINYDSGFSTNNKCNSCKLCEDSCPANNIEVNTSVTWSGNCLACLRCINICKLKAIEYGSKTIDKKRYINPEVSINELRRECK